MSIKDKIHAGSKGKDKRSREVMLKELWEDLESGELSVKEKLECRKLIADLEAFKLKNEGNVSYRVHIAFGGCVYKCVCGNEVKIHSDGAGLVCSTGEIIKNE